MQEYAHLDRVYKELSLRYVTFDKSDDPWMLNGLSSNPFRSIVSSALSTMTTTKRVVSACVPLYERVSSFRELAALSDDELRAIIKPVAHYNRKTKQIKAMALQIIERHNGEVPSSQEELLALSGIGLKCANLMMNFVHQTPLIAVDTHILRLLRRLGVTSTTSAEQCTIEVNRKTSPRYKQHAHEWLIQHGMMVCKARRPSCVTCCISEWCESAAGQQVEA